MKIQFYIRYNTRFGESLHISLNNQEPVPLSYLNEEFWEVTITVDPGQSPELQWSYIFKDRDGELKTEWSGDRKLNLSICDQDYLQVFDTWNSEGAIENVFFTQPFLLGNTVASAVRQPASKGNVLFRVKAPLLKPHEAVCLLGHGSHLGNWETASPIVMTRDGNWWVTRVDLADEHFPVSYKYGVWDTRAGRFAGYEAGYNRTLVLSPKTGKRISAVTDDGFVRIPTSGWRAAGVSIPVFSLKSEKSWGIGEFSDINMLSDWAGAVGMKMIQLLPVNDTTSTRTWTDSYPYAPVSVFALHPVYLNPEKLAGKKHASVLKPYKKQQKALNALETVDYEAVLNMKWEIMRQLYDRMKEEWKTDTAWQNHYRANRYWLDDYAVFCWLRDKYGTPEFSAWPEHSVYETGKIHALIDPASEHYDEIAIHLFVQWHLHLQLTEAVSYAHARGLALKGDLPIGIYRHSVDAWVAPELYNMNTQAGAPPDPFAEKGQNWGFPTYNWDKMKEDGFAWWRRRFEQLSGYFDAFRIDHILGFFRIWSIPLHAVEGILGVFSPAIPLTEEELHEAGTGFSYDRFCKPYITEHVLYEIFGEDAEIVAASFLKIRTDGRFELLPEFSTQRQVEAFFASQSPGERSEKLRQGLYDLIANVILLGDPAPQGTRWKGAFRFNMEATSSFRALPGDIQDKLRSLYVNYFFRRQDDFWEKEAMEKLPALKKASNMLICGEDLGMVPACVPGVMRELGLLSLEIQRMPKAPGQAFFLPGDAPYLSVVTPGTHDMSVLRGWWEEDRDLTRRFYHEVLGEHGDVPFFCEPWIVRKMLAQHLHSPAMWAVFQLQDLLGMDGRLRRQNPHEERINVPANPKHYWRYRMHLTLEDLLQQEGFNREVTTLVRESGRFH